MTRAPTAAPTRIAQRAPPAVAGPEKNVGLLERAFGFLAAGFLFTRGVRSLFLGHGGRALLQFSAGALLTPRSVRGYCGTYAALGVRADDATAFSHPLSRRITVEHSIVVNRPAAELFEFWCDLGNLPRIMQHVQSVRPLDAQRSHWVARGPAGSTIEWDAVITRERAGELIEWHSLPGARVANGGGVCFCPTQRGTVVTVRLFYRPPAGALGAAFARLTGREPRQQVRDDLRRFKQFMEAGEIATARSPSGRRPAEREPSPAGTPAWAQAECIVDL
ncbi:MAG: SRPBCC family protein [Planctomycetota bacterium]